MTHSTYMYTILVQKYPPIFITYSTQSHSPHRYLHSFPTRRSSDLQLSVLAIGLTCFDHLHPGSNLARPIVPSSNRSEEHTSELQSPVHLVCRLLLEKKKLLINSVKVELVDLMRETHSCQVYLTSLQ